MTPERLQEIREPDEVQKARDRALLISEQDKDAPRLTDRLDAQALGVLVAAYDALTADSASLAADYAAAVRALRAAEWGSLEMNESSEAVGESCPVCHRLEDYRRSYGEYLAGHAPGCQLWAILSSPRAVQVLKEVE